MFNKDHNSRGAERISSESSAKKSILSKFASSMPSLGLRTKPSSSDQNKPLQEQLDEANKKIQELQKTQQNKDEKLKKEIEEAKQKAIEQSSKIVEETNKANIQLKQSLKQVQNILTDLELNIIGEKSQTIQFNNSKFFLLVRTPIKKQIEKSTDPNNKENIPKCEDIYWLGLYNIDGNKKIYLRINLFQGMTGRQTIDTTNNKSVLPSELVNSKNYYHDSDISNLVASKKYYIIEDIDINLLKNFPDSRNYIYNDVKRIFEGNQNTLSGQFINKVMRVGEQSFNVGAKTINAATFGSAGYAVNSAKLFANKQGIKNPLTNIFTGTGGKKNNKTQKRSNRTIRKNIRSRSGTRHHRRRA